MVVVTYCDALGVPGDIVSANNPASDLIFVRAGDSPSVILMSCTLVKYLYEMNGITGGYFFP